MCLEEMKSVENAATRYLSLVKGCFIAGNMKNNNPFLVPSFLFKNVRSGRGRQKEKPANITYFILLFFKKKIFLKTFGKAEIFLLFLPIVLFENNLKEQ
jgi:hypothetical protein